MPGATFGLLPISEVKLNLECRDEIIPILRALQHGYGDAELRRELLALVGKDVNGDTSRKHGRRGMNYWEIAVLAATRLGCNLDYDKLQDLAENHRRLRQIMGIGAWQDDEVDFDWRRIEDNLTKLRPETLQKINALIVQAGHVLEPKAIESVRGDCFVVETNIHYPTESSVIADGLRKIAKLAAELAKEHDVEGWRQAKHLLKKVRGLARAIGRASRAKGQGADRLQPGYQKLLSLAEDLVARARQLLKSLRFKPDLSAFTLAKVKDGTAPLKTPEAELLGFIVLTEKVCDNARRRVLHGETLANEEKIHSIFGRVER